MDKVYRRGADVRVALLSAVPRALALHDVIVVPTPEPAPQAPVALVPDRRSWRSAAKRAARLPAKALYRALRPLIRPALFRLRRYLSAELHNDLLRYHTEDQHAIARTSADILRETQASREQLRQELLGGQQQALATQRELFEQRIGQMEQRSPERLLHLFEHMIDTQQKAFAAQRAQFEERLHQMEERSPARLLHLFERTIDTQQEAFAAQRAQLEERLHQMEERVPARLLHLYERTIDTQQQAFGAQHAALADVGGKLQERLDQQLQQHADLGRDLQERLSRVETYAYASARRVIIPSGPERVLIKTEAGYVVCPAADLAVVALLAEAGDLEPGTRLLIGRLLHPGDTFVDVGANLGLHTLAAGRALQGRGRIVAFEPFPNTYRLLDDTLHINGLRPITALHQLAVSDHAGHQSLFLGNTCGHHSLFALTGSDASAAAPVDVQTVRLDDILASDAGVTLVKIDAEGAELDVLRGAAATVAANADIGLIVEFGISHLLRNGHTSAEWLAAFAAFGLVYQAIDPVSGVLQPWSVAQLEGVDSINLLLARPASPLWTRAATP
jgi:FkbM family methyltransferase